MKAYRLVLVATMFGATLGCGPAESVDSSVPEASILAITADPAAFDGMRVRVRGRFLDTGGVGTPACDRSGPGVPTFIDAYVAPPTDMYLVGEGASGDPPRLALQLTSEPGKRTPGSGTPKVPNRTEISLVGTVLQAQLEDLCIKGRFYKSAWFFVSKEENSKYFSR